MRPIALAAALVLLALPAGAQAKRTHVRLSSAPNGSDAGDAWTPLITVAAPHPGRREALRPRVIIRKGDTRRTFRAWPTRRPSVYRATVVFPSRGRWEYAIYDGLDAIDPHAGAVHGFPAVTIGPHEPALATPPRPIGGEMVAASEPAPLDGRLGQPPPRLVQPADARDDGGDGRSGLPLLALSVAPAIAAAALVRRRQRRPRRDRRPYRAAPRQQKAGGRRSLPSSACATTATRDRTTE